MVFIHGGGWQRGDRRFFGGLYGNVGAAFAHRGFLTAVTSYRLSRPLWRVMAVGYAVLAAALGGVVTWASSGDIPFLYAWGTLWPLLFGVRLCLLPRGDDAARHPVHVQDCARAVAFMAREATKYGGDPSKIILAGHSAGAHIAALLAVEPRWLREAGVDPGAVRAVIGLSGVYQPTFSAAVVSRGFEWLYVRSAFGHDRDTWDAAFPVAHARLQAQARRRAAVPTSTDTDADPGGRASADGDGDADAGGTASGSAVASDLAKADAAAPRIPPFCLFNGPGIRDWNLEQHSDALAEDLRAAGVEVETHVVPGASHLGIVRGIQPPAGVVDSEAHAWHPVVRIACDFLRRHVTEAGAEAEAEAEALPPAPLPATATATATAAVGAVSASDVDLHVDASPAAAAADVAVAVTVLTHEDAALREVSHMGSLLRLAATCLGSPTGSGSSEASAAVPPACTACAPDGECDCACATSGPAVYTCACEWRRRLAAGRGGIVVEARVPHAAAEDGTDGTDGELAAFAVCYDRDSDLPAPRGGADASAAGVANLHVWLCGTDPRQRRRGIMSRVFDSLEAAARARAKADALGASVTVATVPARYPAMPGFLAARGYRAYDSGDTSAGKVRLVKHLDA